MIKPAIHINARGKSYLLNTQEIQWIRPCRKSAIKIKFRGQILRMTIRCKDTRDRDDTFNTLKQFFLEREHEY